VAKDVTEKMILEKDMMIKAILPKIVFKKVVPVAKTSVSGVI
jgi:hypothetical protein